MTIQFRWNAVLTNEGGRKVMRDPALNNERAYLYHMLPWPYAKEIFEKRRLRLSPVRSWVDPYERWWCDQLFHKGSKLSGVQAYGLCWTFGAHDEPRWRMAAFGRHDPIVRIRCNVETILTSAKGAIGKHTASLYLGKVCYRQEKEMKQAAERAISAKQVSRTAASMLMQKRNAFQFEEEVRLLWFDRKHEQEAVFIKIDPANTISQIMTSPYACRCEHSEIKAFAKNFGIEVKRSLILQPPR